MHTHTHTHTQTCTVFVCLILGQVADNVTCSAPDLEIREDVEVKGRHLRFNSVRTCAQVTTRHKTSMPPPSQVSTRLCRSTTGRPHATRSRQAAAHLGDTRVARLSVASQRVRPTCTRPSLAAQHRQSQVIERVLALACDRSLISFHIHVRILFELLHFLSKLREPRFLRVACWRGPTVPAGGSSRWWVNDRWFYLQLDGRAVDVVSVGCRDLGLGM